MLNELLADDVTRDQAAAGARARRARRHRLRPHAPPADDPARAGGGMSDRRTRRPGPTCSRSSLPSRQTARRLVAQLRACEISALAFCRLLEKWARGDAEPSTPGERQAAIRRAADRVETGARGPRGAAEALPARARGRGARRPVVVRRPRRRRADRLGARADPRRRAHAAGARRAGVPRARRARACARGPDAPRRSSRRRPTARRSGPGSSTCATTCSARRSRTCASSRARNLPLRWLPV